LNLLILACLAVKEEFKNNLKEVRQKKGLTQEKLESNVGVKRQTIISIERYRYKPSLELAMKIARKLDINTKKLLYFE
jgi:putative transcriptional regulator